MEPAIDGARHRRDRVAIQQRRVVERERVAGAAGGLHRQLRRAREVAGVRVVEREHLRIGAGECLVDLGESEVHRRALVIRQQRDRGFSHLIVIGLDEAQLADAAGSYEAADLELREHRGIDDVRGAQRDRLGEWTPRDGDDREQLRGLARQAQQTRAQRLIE